MQIISDISVSFSPLVITMKIFTFFGEIYWQRY